MNVKCSVYIATSVDGFIANEDGGIEWLHRPEHIYSGEAGLSYEEFISTVDAIVMGRNTYEKVLTFEDWPYDIPVVVLTSRNLLVPDHLQAKVTLESGAPEDVVSRLASQGKKHLYIDGGITIQRFLQAGLIHDITITRIPILLGGGISLFGSLGVELSLKLLESTTSDNGLVQVRYEVKNPV